jgi:hemerythrin-like metal-binding protein
MGLLNWTDQCSVGVAAMDAQHRKLFDMVNEMHDAMRTGRGNDVLSKILDGLVTDTRSHFAAEEQLMESHGYAGYAEHKVMHDALTRQVVDLQKKLRSGKTVMSIEVVLFLKNWLTNHVQVSDKKYTPCLKDKGAA